MTSSLLSSSSPPPPPMSSIRLRVPTTLRSAVLLPSPTSKKTRRWTATIPFFQLNSSRRCRALAVLSECTTEKQYPKIGSGSTGPIPAPELLKVVEDAAKAGAEVVMEAVNKPRNISYKGVTDLVTDTDKSSEVAILEVVKKNFKDHLILGEEGGLIGDSNSSYLWCIDPLGQMDLPVMKELGINIALLWPLK